MQIRARLEFFAFLFCCSKQLISQQVEPLCLNGTGYALCARWFNDTETFSEPFSTPLERLSRHVDHCVFLCGRCCTAFAARLSLHSGNTLRHHCQIGPHSIVVACDVPAVLCCRTALPPHDLGQSAHSITTGTCATFGWVLCNNGLVDNREHGGFPQPRASGIRR